MNKTIENLIQKYLRKADVVGEKSPEAAHYYLTAAKRLNWRFNLA